MPLLCPHCHQNIRSEDVNIRDVLAKCRACHTVFSFHQDVEGKAVSKAPFRPREPVPLPARLRFEELGGGFRVRWRWFQRSFGCLLFFCVFWDGFLVVWYTAGIAGGAPLIFLLFPLMHVAVGAGLTYFVVCGFVNSTTLEVAGGQLTIRHGPLPWRGNLSRPVQDFRQFYCLERAFHSKGHSQPVYDLHAVLTDGSDLKLISDLSESAQALYLEQQIEDRLRIKDAPVEGEVPR